MKIYIIRHEDRTIDASFFAPLTKQGLINSNKLVKILNKLDIKIVYSSPFIRTLQTVHPFTLENKLKINIDYGFSEIMHPTIIPQKSYNVELPDYLCEHFNYQPNYIPIIKSTNLIYPEDELMLINRTKKMFKKVIDKHWNTSDNILIVTHQGICKSILKIISKNININVNDINNYEKGKITLIFDTDHWEFKKIN